jgi:hypothetical protein
MTTPRAHRDHGAVAAAQYGLTRSPQWSAVEKQHLKLQPLCVACKPGTNSQAKLQVHHIFPFHYCIALGRPDLELDQRNLITLCENEAGHPADNHHLLVGHLDDFQSSNLEVVADAQTTFQGMAAADIKQDPRWKQKEAHRLKSLDQMTPQDKADFLAQMNARFPKL